MSGFDSSAISVIDPDHDHFKNLDIEESTQSNRRVSQEFYNEVVQAYNDISVGSIMIIPLPEHIKYHNLRNILKNRGLEIHEDYRISRQELDGEGNLLPVKDRPAKLKRISATPGKICS